MKEQVNKGGLPNDRGSLRRVVAFMDYLSGIPRNMSSVISCTLASNTPLPLKFDLISCRGNMLRIDKQCPSRLGNEIVNANRLNLPCNLVRHPKLNLFANGHSRG